MAPMMKYVSYPLLVPPNAYSRWARRQAPIHFGPMSDGCHGVTSIQGLGPTPYENLEYPILPPTTRSTTDRAPRSGQQ